jgi:hypothetical protein
MKKSPPFPPKQFFQPLEKFPIIGNFLKTALLLFFVSYGSFALAAPQPSFSYHGQITTETGKPYPATDQATLIIRSGDRVISRTSIQRSGVAGCNYVAEIPLDSDTSPYREYALRSGAGVTFAVVDANNREMPLYALTPIPAVGRPGTTRRLDLSAGLDSVGDGLTDAFRQLIADASYGQITTPEEVLPDDDFDGDGMSNIDEFRSATDPTWADDVLHVAQFRPVQGRVAFEFFAVEGVAYSICGASELDADGRFIWNHVPWAIDPDAALQDTPFTGRGSLATLYLPLDQPIKIFKLSVE